MQLLAHDRQSLKNVQNNPSVILDQIGISLQVRRDFSRYRSIRFSHVDTRLNQAFDPQHVEFGTGDFWLLAENREHEPIATYCTRRFVVGDFYDLICSLALWFSVRPRPADARFVVNCQIPPFGGEVLHSGRLWIREDYRGFSRLAAMMPRLARAVAWRDRPFDHDSAMIRNDPRDRPDIVDRKAVYMGKKVYGFARVHRFVDGWFPPEGREAVMHLCHATRAEAMATLLDSKITAEGRGAMPNGAFRPQPALIEDCAAYENSQYAVPDTDVGNPRPTPRRCDPTASQRLPAAAASLEYPDGL